MEPISNKFYEDYEKLSQAVDGLKKLLKENNLPDDLDSPEVRDAIEVRWFSDKAYDLGCEVTALAEEMMVAKEVERNYADKLEEKEGPREFEGYAVGQ